MSWLRRGFTTPLLDMIIYRNVRSLVGGKIRLMLSGKSTLLLLDLIIYRNVRSLVGGQDSAHTLWLVQPGRMIFSYIFTKLEVNLEIKISIQLFINFV